MSTSFLTNLQLNKNQLLQPVLHNASSAPSSPVNGQAYYDTTLNQLGISCNGTWIYLSSASGTVTTVSVASANGFGGSVATATTTPAITITTSVTGLLKGNGTAVSAAVSGTDYAPATSGSSSLKGNGSGGFAAATLNDNGAPTADFSMASHKLTNVTDPVSAQDAATKNYVDTVAQGLGSKASARVATTGSETFTISSGNVTQITGTTVDGVSPSVGDVILVKDAPSATGTGSAMSSQPGNGTYTVTSNTTNLSLSRTTGDTGLGATTPAGAYVFVEAGTTNASAGYVVSSPSSSAAFTYGTTAIQFVQFSGAGEVVAGTALSKSGNTLNVTTVPIANGGTGQITQQAALDAIAGSQTSGSFLRGNGTHVTMQALQAADIPTNPNVAPGSLSTNSQKIAVIYNTTITGNGSATTFTVTHNLGNANPLIQVYDSSGNVVITDANNNSGSTTSSVIGFAVAPANLTTYKVVVVG